MRRDEPWVGPAHARLGTGAEEILDPFRVGMLADHGDDHA
ncbi:MAG: hypothetical protein QOK42_1176 [Frankiaceae bacterium]|nr:hypothetical protein [Frankiaceae bacterium]